MHGQTSTFLDAGQLQICHQNVTMAEPEKMMKQYIGIHQIGVPLRQW